MVTLINKHLSENIQKKDSNGVSILSYKHCLSYCAPIIVCLWLVSPIGIIQGIYAKYYGLSLATLAWVILAARVFDAITDPIIGYYSDRHYRLAGTRKPFVLAGGLLLIVSSYFLYVPTDIEGIGAGSTSKISTTYFIVWFFAFYLAYTVIEIPHVAWASDLAKTADEKSKIYSFRGAVAYIGMFIFFGIPLLPIFETNEITPVTLEVSVVLAGVIMLPLLYFCIAKTPSGAINSGSEVAQLKKQSSRSGQKQYWRIGLESVIGNRPILIFYGAYLMAGFGAGMWFGLIFLYVDSYLGMGAQFAQMFLIAFAIGTIAVPMWCKLSMIFGKRFVLASGVALQLVSYIYTGILTPGEVNFWELISLKMVNTIGSSSILAIAPAMLSEIIDFSKWKFRAENTAIYYALQTFFTKINVGLGMALSLAVAGWYGFDATTTAQSQEGIVGLMMSMVWIPSGFAAIAIVLFLLNPINARRHNIIRRRLEFRTFREDHLRL